MPIILRHRYFAFNNGTIEPVLGFMAGIGMSWLHHWSRALSAITVLPCSPGWNASALSKLRVCLGVR